MLQDLRQYRESYDPQKKGDLRRYTYINHMLKHVNFCYFVNDMDKVHVDMYCAACIPISCSAKSFLHCSHDGNR